MPLFVDSPHPSARALVAGLALVAAACLASSAPHTRFPGAGFDRIGVRKFCD
jgi:hypothetical protein